MIEKSVNNVHMRTIHHVGFSISPIILRIILDNDLSFKNHTHHSYASHPFFTSAQFIFFHSDKVHRHYNGIFLAMPTLGTMHISLYLKHSIHISLSSSLTTSNPLCDLHWLPMLFRVNVETVLMYTDLSLSQPR